MTTTLAVLIDADGPDTALHRMVLSGLANSYRLVDRDAEVVVANDERPREAGAALRGRRPCGRH